jgi:hypothetical protein
VGAVIGRGGVNSQRPSLRAMIAIHIPMTTLAVVECKQVAMVGYGVVVPCRLCTVCSMGDCLPCTHGTVSAEAKTDRGQTDRHATMGVALARPQV